jgi:hypothetical protein
MPKYGIHQITLQKTIEKLRQSNQSNERVIGNNLQINNGLSNLGAIGPDLFFWAPDYELADKLFNFYDEYRKVIDIYNQVVAPIETIKQAAGDVVDATVGSLAPSSIELIKLSLDKVRETATDLKTALSSQLLFGLLGINDLFYQMGLIPNLTNSLFNTFAPTLQSQLNSGATIDISSWYWFDLLHYRRTGLFGQNLINNSTNDYQKAYGYGYLSHISTDTIGHAFVNQVVGGPYRLNVQKHALVENYMDTWAYKYYYDSEISETLLSKLNLPDPNNLPSDIIDIIDRSLRMTYNNLFPTRLRNPGFLTRDEIKKTYERFYTILEITSSMNIKRPDKPFDNVEEILSQALEDLMEAPPSPPSTSVESCSWQDILSAGLTSSSRDCYEEFFNEAGKYFEYLGELLIWTFETLLDIIDLIIASLLSLPISALLALLYGVQLLAYQMYNVAKQAIAEAGITYPSSEMLNTSIGLAVTSTCNNCSPPFKYPRFREDSFSHFVCPASNLEDPSTAADFNQPLIDILPNTFIENIAFDISSLRAYALSASPTATREYEHQAKRIGNAVDFSRWLISTSSDSNNPDRPLTETDWNLDSDRGYGYKNWKGLGDNSNSQERKINSESYM